MATYDTRLKAASGVKPGNVTGMTTPRGLCPLNSQQTASLPVTSWHTRVERHTMQADGFHPVSTTFAFARLPVQLQLRICSIFCSRCEGAYLSPISTLYVDDYASFQTLKSLCETNPNLNAIAQPILYHPLHVNLNTPFFRTLIARSDLAASVHVFTSYYNEGQRGFWNAAMDQEDFVYLKRVARGLGYHLKKRHKVE